MLKLSCGHYADEDYYLAEIEVRFEDQLESIEHRSLCKECFSSWEEITNCKLINVQLVEFG